MIIVDLLFLIGKVKKLNLNLEIKFARLRSSPYNYEAWYA
tara:strand:+ start:1282 stop:1401 length:120 start_codon:yes stop_codon:yes gene_type:complete